MPPLQEFAFAPLDILPDLLGRRSGHAAAFEFIVATVQHLSSFAQLIEITFDNLFENVRLVPAGLGGKLRNLRFLVGFDDKAHVFIPAYFSLRRHPAKGKPSGKRTISSRERIGHLRPK